MSAVHIYNLVRKVFLGQVKTRNQFHAVHVATFTITNKNKTPIYLFSTRSPEQVNISVSCFKICYRENISYIIFISKF